MISFALGQKPPKDVSVDGMELGKIYAPVIDNDHKDSSRFAITCGTERILLQYHIGNRGPCVAGYQWYRFRFVETQDEIRLKDNRY